MGWCYVDLEKHDAAIATFEQALEHAPRSADGHMGLAEAFKAKNMKRDAVKHYREYLDISPEGPESAVAKRMLEELKQ